MDSQMYWVYILYCNNHTYYTGYTNNLEKRYQSHVDGTGRLQTVDKNITPRYYALIDAFRIKTGVPILLNTSFNENEPIVNTPEEALNCFLRTQMDMLVLENCIIDRNNL